MIIEITHMASATVFKIALVNFSTRVGFDRRWRQRRRHLATSDASRAEPRQVFRSKRQIGTN